MIPPSFRCSFVALLTLSLTPLAFAGVELKQEDDKVRVEIDGKLFTEYHFTNCRRPYLYPIIGPTGGAMTRHWPLEEDIAAEERDHPHHKGLWYGHRKVSGVGFWEDTNLDKGGPYGQMVHDGFVAVQSGENEGFLTAKNKWVVDGTGEVIGTDVRTIRFHKTADGPMIDYNITIHAGDKDMVFGDDKDGTMAIRVPESMRAELPKQKGEKTGQPGQGHIVTSEGRKDADAWGTRGDWCDYYGPVEGQTAGIAMFDCPTNPRHPTWWHVRTYGLFAANPFGVSAFEKLPDKGVGEYTVRKGQETSFRYRFYFHAGDTEQANVAKHYAEYAAENK